MRPKLGSKKVTGIRPLDVQEVIDALNERGLSPKTVREAHMVLSRSLKQAVRWRLIIFNPAQDAALPKKVRKEMKTLTPQQAQKFLSSRQRPTRDCRYGGSRRNGSRPDLLSCQTRLKVLNKRCGSRTITRPAPLERRQAHVCRHISSTQIDHILRVCRIRMSDGVGPLSR